MAFQPHPGRPETILGLCWDCWAASGARCELYRLAPAPGGGFVLVDGRPLVAVARGA